MRFESASEVDVELEEETEEVEEVEEVGPDVCSEETEVVGPSIEPIREDGKNDAVCAATVEAESGRKEEPGWVQRSRLRPPSPSAERRAGSRRAASSAASRLRRRAASAATTAARSCGRRSWKRASEGPVTLARSGSRGAKMEGGDDEEGEGDEAEDEGDLGLKETSGGSFEEASRVVGG